MKNMTPLKIVQLVIIGTYLFQNCLAETSGIAAPETDPKELDVNFAPLEDGPTQELARNERAFGRLRNYDIDDDIDVREEVDVSDDYTPSTSRSRQRYDDDLLDSDLSLSDRDYSTSLRGAEVVSQNDGRPIVVRTGYRGNDLVKRYRPVEHIGRPWEAKSEIIKTRPQTIVHHQSPILIKRRPTKLEIPHPPVLVRPSPVVFQRESSIESRPVIHKQLPRKVEIRPYVVKVERPVEKKILLDRNRKPCSHRIDDDIRGSRLYDDDLDRDYLGVRGYSRGYSRDYARGYDRDYAGDYVSDYDSGYSRDTVRDYSRDGLRDYSSDSWRDYGRDSLRDYSVSSDYVE